MHILSLLVGVLIGAAAVLVYNIAHGTKVDKLSADLKDEIAKLRYK